MKKFQHTHLLLTAVSVPVAILVCWLVYKRTGNKKDNTNNRKDNLLHEKKMVEKDGIDSTEELTSTKNVNELAAQENLDSVDSGISFVADKVNDLSIPTSNPDVSDFKASSNKSLNISLEDLQYSRCTDDISFLSAAESTQPESNMMEMRLQEKIASSSDTTVKETLTTSSDAIVKDATVIKIHQPLTTTIESDCLSPKDISKLSQGDYNDPMPLNNTSENKAEHIDSTIHDLKCLSNPPTASTDELKLDEILCDSAVDENIKTLPPITENITVNGNSDLPTTETIEASDLTDTNMSDEVTVNDDISTNDANLNNNNSTDKPLTNGQSDSPTRSSPCSEKSNQYCVSCNKIKSPLTSDNEQNGWGEDTSSKTDTVCKIY